VAEFFGSGHCFLLAKGRVGLYVGLRALGLPPGAKVLLPGYTCVVVPSALQYAGLQPVYVDIHPDTYNVDPALLDRVPPDVAAVVVQHTYGIPADLAALGRWAAGRGIPLIEDCCHIFGVRAGGRLCGTWGAFSFMSGQWNKPFSTGLGGILLVNDAGLAERVGEILDREALSPGRLKSLLLAVQIMAFRFLVRPETAARMTSLYRAASTLGLAVGSSSTGEYRGVRPAGYLSRMAACQAREGLREMAAIDENLQHRARLTAWYQQRLPGLGLAALGAMPAEGLPLLRYPVRVANKQELLAAAASQRLEIGSWFEVPLHPAGTRHEDFGYRQGMCPAAERACAEVINLPTHRRVGEQMAERTLDFLRVHARPVDHETE
jgi:dTDP-4-amino-4,6-dideoxygalactose transaminase